MFDGYQTMFITIQHRLPSLNGEKEDLSQGYWNQTRKMWVTTLFSKI